MYRKEGGFGMKKYWYVFVALFVCLVSLLSVYFIVSLDAYDPDAPEDEKLIQRYEKEVGSEIDVIYDFVEDTGDSFSYWIDHENRTITDHVTLRYSMENLTDEQKDSLARLSLELATLQYEKNKWAIRKDFPGYTHTVEVLAINNSDHIYNLHYDYDVLRQTITDVNREMSEASQSMDQFSIQYIEDHHTTLYWRNYY